MPEAPGAVIDYFGIMGVPRRPWLDEEALKERFLALSSDLHPDRFHGHSEQARSDAQQIYADLNTAYQTLREPRLRLQHLLRLERGEAPGDIQSIPPGTMELFISVGEACREVDAFLAERGQIQSPMLKVRLFQQGLEWTERLNALLREVAAKARAGEEELRQLNDFWDRAPAPGIPGRTEALPLDRLENIYRVLSYVNRWTSQVRERRVRLATPE